MRFMMIVKGDADYEAGRPPSPDLMAAIGKLAEEMFQRGIMVDMGGLLPSFAGARVKAGDGKLSITHGPFAETNELIGGYAIMQAESREEAIELGKRFMSVHTEILGPKYQGELEIRQMYESGPCAGEPGAAPA